LLVLLVPLSLIGTVGQLAAATVLMLLTVFSVVNVALLILKRRAREPAGLFEIHAVVPLFGAIVCAVLVAVRVTTGDWRAPALAGAMLVGIALTYLAGKLRAG
jgi:amino acid transporter